MKGGAKKKQKRKLRRPCAPSGLTQAKEASVTSEGGKEHWQQYSLAVSVVRKDGLVRRKAVGTKRSAALDKMRKNERNRCK